MFFDEIIHGTQYYRTPTPLPEEWAGDIASMADFGLDAFQIRINWRWNEKREGEYDFSDIDRLLELAEQNGRKVIMKFLLECAPQYVFDKYGGTRIGPKGEQIRGGAHGAFYGGWRPCFTNPEVARAAGRFVEKVAERYHDRSCIILWNAWNEIRNKPVEDCFCPHCRAAFGRYLKKKFGTVEELNRFYGAAEESFETIALPAMPHGYWDIYEFKKFKGGENLYEYLRIVYDAVRRYDTVRPIMAHVGCTAAFQSALGDVCDDYTVSRAVDFWGTSLPLDTNMSTTDRRLEFQMLMDYLRSLDDRFFVHEIYPGLGMFRWYDTPFDMNFKLYSALAGGARGLVYWQYRAERVGHENDCSGIMRMDGSPRPVAYAVRDFGAELHRNMPYFTAAAPEKADIAIVFDFNSMLMSEIEDSIGADFSFEQNAPRYYYRNAHAGMYRLLRQKNYAVDYVGVTHAERFADYRVLYFPYYTMLDPAIVPALKTFVENGGILIADEGFGMRTPNTWMQPYDIDAKALFTARMTERRYIGQETATIGGGTVKIAPFRTLYTVEGGRVTERFADGTPALFEIPCGKGTVYLAGFSIGYSYMTDPSPALADAVERMLGGRATPYAIGDFAGELYERRSVGDGYEIVFLFNNTDTEKPIDRSALLASAKTLTATATAVGGFLREEGDAVIIPPQSMGYVILK